MQRDFGLHLDAHHAPIGESPLALLRFGLDGTADGTFGTGAGRALVVQQIPDPTIASIAVLRLQADGTPDASFGIGGWAIHPLEAAIPSATRYELDALASPDGFLYVLSATSGASRLFRMRL